MTSIRRHALRALLSLVAAVAVGLIGANAAAAQTTSPSDIAWSSPSDIAW